MPAISRIRYTNVVYENGAKRYIDNTFQFEGYNGVILLENGGGKTVFLQTLIQAVLPHEKVADRKIAETLLLNNNIAHIAVEWILNDNPRRYALTAVSLYINSKDELASYKFAYEYGPQDGENIETLPFVRKSGNRNRPANRDEIAEFYRNMSNKYMVARFFSDNDSIKSYQKYIEDSFKIIPVEWAKLASINTSEGGVEEYFSKCATTGELVDRLLVPTVEEALAGEGTKDFVELFEKQREHFKKQIELSERIEECRAVDQELTHYNSVLKECYDLELALTNHKEELKAVFQVVSHTQAKCAAELTAAHLANDAVKEELKYNSQQEQALELAVAKQRVAAQADEKQLEEAAYSQAFGIMTEKQGQFDTLKAAQYRAFIKIQDEIIGETTKAIELLEADEETIDIQDELEENAGELKGYFVSQEYDIQKGLGLLEGKIQAAQNEQGLLAQSECRIGINMQEVTRKIGDAEGKIKILVDLQDKIERQVLADNINTKVEVEYEKWQIQLPNLEAEYNNIQQHIIQCEQEKENIKLALPRLHEYVDLLKSDEFKNNNDLKNIENQLTELLAKIKNIKELALIVPDTNSIYQREKAIINQLEANLEQLRKVKEQALLKERLAHKFLDEYADNNYFTADASLEKRINNWQNGFTFLECGTEYYHRACSLGNDPTEIFDNYPYWAITVITTDSELDKLAAKLENCRHELTHAVILLTEQEAREIITGYKVETMRHVMPSYWFGNMMPEGFSSWLSNIKSAANEASAEKNIVEEEFNHCRNLLKEIKNFYTKYSFNEYQQLLNTQLELSTKLELETRKLKSLHESLEEIDKLLVSYGRRLIEFKGHIEKVSSNKRLATEYFEYKRNHIAALSEKNNLGNKFTMLQNEQVSLRKKIADAGQMIQDLSDEKRDVVTALNTLKDKPFYQEVQTAPIKSTDVTYETLAHRRRDLLDRLVGKQKNRGELNEKLNNAIKNKNEWSKQLQNFKQTIESVIDEECCFPAAGEDLLNRLTQDIISLKGNVKALSKAYQSAKDKLLALQSSYETLETGYHKKYKEKITFTQDLAEVGKMIEGNKVKLIAQETHLSSLINELVGKVNKFELVITKMKQKNEKLEFMGEGVKMIILTTFQAEGLINDAHNFVNELINKAEQLYYQVQDKLSNNDKSKRKFIIYCEQVIKDDRLKRAIVDGAIAKTSYLDFFNWQINMKNRIGYTIRLAEKEKQEHHTHTEQIISYIYTHLVRIAEELRTIPRKTRVKIDDSYKEIFVFDVPEWEEKQGKEILRNYCDSLTKKFDTQEFKDDSGNDIPGKIKKTLQVWLKTQQLLMQLLGETQIKVKCRKATNDNRISSYAYSWEESNKWSGGEKWSKNMALFLGCLNYLAEKRKHLIFGAKRNRVVIADNPFGKASSEHVLNPVFFICQQLGFQFIALTAHDEGAFIRKYFPIVYSCKFDLTKDQKGQVIHAEKEIKTAFFRDHDPEVLERLNNYKNVVLFDPT